MGLHLLGHCVELGAVQLHDSGVELVNGFLTLLLAGALIPGGGHMTVT